MKKPRAAPKGSWTLGGATQLLAARAEIDLGSIEEKGPLDAAHMRGQSSWRKEETFADITALSRSAASSRHCTTKLEKRNPLGAWTRELGLALLCFWSGFLWLPLATDAVNVDPTFTLQLEAPDGSNRDALQGESFRIQPRLTLRDQSSQVVVNNAGISVTATCVTNGCFMDCGNAPKETAGECSAVTDASGEVSLFVHSLHFCLALHN